MTDPSFAQPASQLGADIPNTAQPTGGQGLSLTPDGKIPPALLKGVGSTQFISEIDLSTTTAFTAIPSTFRHLKIYAVLRSSRVAVTDSAFLAFNADAGANYDYSFIQGNNGSATAVNGIAQTSLEFAAVPCASATASMFAIVEITIPYYALTTNFKSFQSVNFADTNESAATLFNEVMGGTWRNAAVITQVSLVPNTGVAWVTGSKASLYGIA